MNLNIHSQPSRPRRILVVEDDADIRQIFFEVLIGSGYRVETAEDGDAAWNVLKAASKDRESYDLLITDNSMPKLSGVELVRKLRSARVALPVILASSTAPVNAEDLKLAAVIQKPFFPAQLVQTVNEVLRADNPPETLALKGDQGPTGNKLEIIQINKIHFKRLNLW